MPLPLAQMSPAKVEVDHKSDWIVSGIIRHRAIDASNNARPVAIAAVNKSPLLKGCGDKSEAKGFKQALASGRRCLQNSDQFERFQPS